MSFEAFYCMLNDSLFGVESVVLDSMISSVSMYKGHMQGPVILVK